MVCPRCAKQNPDEDQYCGRCGTDLSIAMKAAPPSADEKPCFRHRREMTALSCGKCEKPICHRCAILGPAGPRCPDCARRNIPFSWRGFLAETKMGMRHMMGSSPYTIYLWVILAGILFSTFRGCIDATRTSNRIQIEQSEER